MFDISKIGGVILRPVDTRLPKSVWSKSLYGKTMIEWVKGALSNKCAVVDYRSNQEIPPTVKGVIDRSFEYTAVLYADTPFVSRKTIIEATQTLEKKELNVLKMTRGYIFKTDYLITAERTCDIKTYFFGDQDFITAFDSHQFSIVSDILRQRILHYHMDNGVVFEDSTTAYVDCHVKIGKNVIVEPNNILRGMTTIADGVKLLSGNVIEDSIIGEDAIIDGSRVYKSSIGMGTTIGPFAYIRPDSNIGANCRIGDFVEIKSSIIGDGCKVSHLSYVGDALLGSNCNIGCGVVFVNYDGKKKHKTTVGDKVFIGSNCNIIAPLKIEDNAFIAAGSTLNGDVPKEALAIARARQVNKLGYNAGGKKF